MTKVGTAEIPSARARSQSASTAPPKGTGSEHLFSLRAGEIEAQGQIDEDVGVADVTPLNEISPEDRRMKPVLHPLRLGPLAEFLGPSTVKRLFTFTPRQPLLGGNLLQPGQHAGNVLPPSGKKLRQGQTFLGCFRVQGKRPPADLYFEFPFQPVNTPGTEIAPGSNIIGKYFECKPVGHDRKSPMRSPRVRFSAFIPTRRQRFPKRATRYRKNGRLDPRCATGTHFSR